MQIEIPINYKSSAQNVLTILCPILCPSLQKYQGGRSPTLMILFIMYQCFKVWMIRFSITIINFEFRNYSLILCCQTHTQQFLKVFHAWMLNIHVKSSMWSDICFISVGLLVLHKYSNYWTTINLRFKRV